MAYIVPKKYEVQRKIHENSKTACESKRDLKIRLLNGQHGFVSFIDGSFGIS